MNRDFRRLTDSLDPSHRQLVAMQSVRGGELPRDTPQAGIYLFTERGRHLYVGRSNRLRDRINEHGRPSSGHNTAPFAFRLARKAMGRESPTYQTTGSRTELEVEPAFKEAFLRAKERVRRMEVRYVEERDPLRQALLEIYVAVALRTPYNTFETH